MESDKVDPKMSALPQEIIVIVVVVVVAAVMLALLALAVFFGMRGCKKETHVITCVGPAYDI